MVSLKYVLRVLTWTMSVMSVVCKANDFTKAFGEGSLTDAFGSEASSPLKYLSPDHLRQEGCQINIGVSMSRLMSAGLDVTKARGACEHARGSTQQTLLCVSEAASAIAAFAHTAEFLTEGIQACEGTRLGPEQCSAAILGLTAELNTIVSAATAIKASFSSSGKCIHAQPHPQPDPLQYSDAPGQGYTYGEGLPTTGVILEAFHISKPKLKKATCLNDASNALGFLVAAGTTISTATSKCFDNAPNRTDQPCWVLADKVVESLSYAGAFLALMVEDCTFEVDPKFRCAGMVSKLFAGITGLAAHAGRLRHVCQVPEPSHPGQLYAAGAPIESTDVAGPPPSLVGVCIGSVVVAAIVGFFAGMRRASGPSRDMQATGTLE